VDDTNGIRERFQSLDLLSLTFENIFSGPLTGGGGRGRSQNARVQIALANHTLGNRVWATFLSVPTGRYGLGPQPHYFF